MPETQSQSLGWEDAWEKEMATHSSILDWEIPRTEEPGKLYGPWGHKKSDMTRIEQQKLWFTYFSTIASVKPNIKHPGFTISLGSSFLVKDPISHKPTLNKCVCLSSVDGLDWFNSQTPSREKKNKTLRD